DRMEVIRIPGYTEDEKVEIVKRHLFKKQTQLNGIKVDELSINDSALRDIIRYYCREAGVRNLEREIAKICRKVVRDIDSKRGKASSKTKITVTPETLEKYLKVKKFRYGVADEHDQVGQVTGLAWTEVGGELLHIEAASLPGKGKAI